MILEHPGRYMNIIHGRYDTVISNKEHLYSKKVLLGKKSGLTFFLNQGLFYPLMKPSPTPLFRPLYAP
jgi:hypothetical protein